jgi:hypothetical protein
LPSELTWFCKAATCSLVAYEVQPEAAAIINNTNVSKTTANLFFNFSLLILLASNYSGISPGMPDSRLTNS